MVSKIEAKEKIQRLIDKYKRIVDSGKIKEYHEERTKNEFIEPLFEALGWDVRNSEREDEVIKEDRVSKGRVDYAFRLNGTLKFFLEAKALKKALDEEKSSTQAIDYAYHKKVSWAVVCDFESLRVYNSEWRGKKLFERRFLTLNTSSYIENFDKLWWLSREGFENGILDKEADVTGKRKLSVPIDQQLLSDFMLWRKSLFDNIMKNSLKHVITTEKVEEVVQNILDRLIFIRTCEDRGLEDKVLWQALIESKGSKKSLLHHLREVFTDFDEKYNSKLFVKSESDGVNIDDFVLKDIIHGLYGSRDEELTYDFSLIDADILGSIYEQYLGHIMKQMPKRTKLKENDVHKKGQGIYYTPTFIVDYIVKNTIGQMIEKKPLSEIQNIKVLDPACGSGSFLIKAFQLLYDDMKKRNGQETITKNQILKNNIFGVDLDQKAVEIAQLNLLLQAADKRIRLPNLQKNIRRGNSLIDDSNIAQDTAFQWEEEFKEILKDGGFDVVIGNPPYVRVDSLSEKDKGYWKIKFKSSQGKYDLYYLFIESVFKWLKPGGICGFIVPNKFCAAHSAKNLREIIKNNTINCTIISVSHLDVFKDASNYPVIIIFRKGKGLKKLDIGFVKDQKEIIENNFTKFSITNEDLETIPNGIFPINVSHRELDLATRLIKENEPLSNFLKISEGLRIPSSMEKEKAGDFEILKQFQFERWGGIKRGSYISKSDLSKVVNPKSERFINLEKSKIVIAEDALRITATLDEYKRVPQGGVYFGVQIVEQPQIKYILSLLNSKLLSFIYSTFFGGMHMGGGYLRYRTEFLNHLPIKFNQEKQKELIKLIDKMLSLNERLLKTDEKSDTKSKIEEEIKNMDKEIDELIYNIYGINKEEQKIIEENVK